MLLVMHVAHHSSLNAQQVNNVIQLVTPFNIGRTCVLLRHSWRKTRALVPLVHNCAYRGLVWHIRAICQGLQRFFVGERVFILFLEGRLQVRVREAAGSRAALNKRVSTWPAYDTLLLLSSKVCSSLNLRLCACHSP